MQFSTATATFADRFMATNASQEIGEVHPGLYAALRYLGTLGNGAASELSGILRANRALRASALENLFTSLHISGRPISEDKRVADLVAAGVPRHLLRREWPRTVDVFSADDLVKSRALPSILKNLSRLRLSSFRVGDLALVAQPLSTGRLLLRVLCIDVADMPRQPFNTAEPPPDETANRVADALERLERLTSLDMERFFLGSRTVSVLAQLDRLEKLTVNVDELQLRQLLARRCCPQLTELCARVSSSVKSTSGETVANSHGGAHGHARLAVLDLHFYGKWHGFHPVTLRNLPTSLRALRISGMRQVALVETVRVAGPQPQVTELTIKIPRRVLAFNERPDAPLGGLSTGLAKPPPDNMLWLQTAFPALRKLDIDAYVPQSSASLSIDLPLVDLRFSTTSSEIDLRFGPACRDKLARLEVAYARLTSTDLVQMPRLRVLKLGRSSQLLQTTRLEENLYGSWENLEEFAVDGGTSMLDVEMLKLFRVVGDSPALRRLSMHANELKLLPRAALRQLDELRVYCARGENLDEQVLSAATGLRTLGLDPSGLLCRDALSGETCATLALPSLRNLRKLVLLVSCAPEMVALFGKAAAPFLEGLPRLENVEIELCHWVSCALTFPGQTEDACAP